jgi:tetratricopeptide (TPR) repeat protein
MKNVYRYLLAAMLTITPPLVMAASNGLEEALSTALAQFDRATEGDKDALRSALQTFETLAKQNPDHPLLEARIGSLITMQARNAWAPWKKMRYAEQGLDHIDRALEQLTRKDDYEWLRNLPVSYDVYLTAASTFVALPKFFNRLGQAERLLQKLTTQARFSKVPNAFQAAVWLTRARVAQRQDHDVDYKLYLQRAVALDPGGKSGHLARSMLSQGD